MARAAERGTGAFVTGPQLAQYLYLSPERIRQLTKDGMPTEGRGRYDILLATRWYVRFLQEANKRRETPGGVGGADALRVERAAALQIATERERIALARDKRELVSVTEVGRLFENAVGTFKEKMLAGVGRAGGRLLGARTQAQANSVVEEVILDALSAMSQIGNDWIESANGHRNGTAR